MLSKSLIKAGILALLTFLNLQHALTAHGAQGGISGGGTNVRELPASADAIALAIEAAQRGKLERLFRTLELRSIRLQKAAQVLSEEDFSLTDFRFLQHADKLFGGKEGPSVLSFDFIENRSAQVGQIEIHWDIRAKQPCIDPVTGREQDLSATRPNTICVSISRLMANPKVTAGNVNRLVLVSIAHEAAHLAGPVLPQAEEEDFANSVQDIADHILTPSHDLETDVTGELLRKVNTMERSLRATLKLVQKGMPFGALCDQFVETGADGAFNFAFEPVESWENLPGIRPEHFRQLNALMLGGTLLILQCVEAPTPGQPLMMDPEEEAARWRKVFPNPERKAMSDVVKNFYPEFLGSRVDATFPLDFPADATFARINPSDRKALVRELELLYQRAIKTKQAFYQIYE